MWTILAIVMIITLCLYWRGQNAVWGGFAIGLIGGLIAAVIFLFLGKGFLWSVVGKWIVTGSLLGLGAEFLSKLSNSEKKKP